MRPVPSVLANLSLDLVLPEPPEVVGGRYVLGEAIGRGGMGVVYLANQDGPAPPVAVKVLHRNLISNPAILEHFRREALAAARVAHPNLVAVIDVGDTEDGTPFLVMEYVPGRRLGELVRERPLESSRAIAIVDQILAALAEIHRCGVIHADVTSDNILVDSTRDGGDRIKIVDFGLAHIGLGEPSTAEYEATVIAGTPEFMAPEVIHGAAPTVASDLYGAGVVLYELLTGATPFAGGAAAQIMRRHLDTPVIPPSLRRPDRIIGRDLDAVVMRALAKSPSARFRDAEEFAASLRVAGLPPAAPCWCHICGAAIACPTDGCVSCGGVDLSEDERLQLAAFDSDDKMTLTEATPL